MSWNAPLCFLHPCWLGKFSRASRAQALSSPGCPRRHPALHHPTRWPQTLFFQFSPSPSSFLGLFSQQGWLPRGPPSTTTQHFSRSHISVLTPLPASRPPSPAHLGAAGATPTRWRCRVRAPRGGPLSQSHSGALFLRTVPSPSSKKVPIPPARLSPSLQHVTSLAPHRRGGGPQRRSPQFSAAASSSRTPFHSPLFALVSHEDLALPGGVSSFHLDSQSSLLPYL